MTATFGVNSYDIYKSIYLAAWYDYTTACDDDAVIGLWFNGQRHFGNVLPVSYPKSYLTHSSLICADYPALPYAQSHSGEVPHII